MLESSFAATCQVKLADNGFTTAPPGKLVNASLNGFKMLLLITVPVESTVSPILIALEFVYNVASGPKYKFTSPSLDKFCNPSIGLVYLTPDVSTYIPIEVISESCGLSR